MMDYMLKTMNSVLKMMDFAGLFRDLVLAAGGE